MPTINAAIFEGIVWSRQYNPAGTYAYTPQPFTNPGADPACFTRLNIDSGTVTFNDTIWTLHGYIGNVPLYVLPDPKNPPAGAAVTTTAIVSNVGCRAGTCGMICTPVNSPPPSQLLPDDLKPVQILCNCG